jgi:hypothetical protein
MDVNTLVEIKVENGDIYTYCGVFAQRKYVEAEKQPLLGNAHTQK